MGDVMDATLFDSRITDLKVQIGTVKGTMEMICRSFVTAAERFIMQWVEDEIQHARDRHPEIILNMSDAQLRELKEELQELIRELPSRIAAAINNERVWSHRQDPFPETENPANRYASSRNRPPQEMDRLIRSLMGHLGAILLKHQLGNSAKEQRWDVQVYPPRFMAALEWKESMSLSLDRYSGMHEKLVKLHESVNEATRRKLQLLAAARWDQVE